MNKNILALVFLVAGTLLTTAAVLKHVLEIGQAASDPKIKLEARRIANDCYRYIMDLCTNAGIVSDALKYVTHKKEQIDTLKKLDERINEEAIDNDEEMTT